MLTPEIQQLVARAEGGDPTALAPLRRLLAEVPQLWQQHGDLAAWAERNWLNLVAGHDLMVRTSVELRLDELRRELGAPDDSPVIQLLVRRVVASWLQVHYAEAHLPQLRQTHASEAQLRVAERFLDHSQSRYLAAIRQLANVRKFLRPRPGPLDLVTETLPNSAHRDRSRQDVKEGEVIFNERPQGISREQERQP